MPIVQQPIVEFQCPGCKQMVRVVGGADAVCCGQYYRLELLIHQETQADHDAWEAELARLLAQGNQGQPVTIPPLPPAHTYPTI